MKLGIKYKGNLIRNFKYTSSQANNKEKKTWLKLGEGQVAYKQDGSLVVHMEGVTHSNDGKIARQLKLDVDIIYQVQKIENDEINEGELKKLIHRYALPSATMMYEELIRKASSIDDAPPIVIDNMDLTGNVTLTSKDPEKLNK